MARPSPGNGTGSRKNRVLSRREIEGMIADGRHILIVEGKVLGVDAWMPYHPGGDKSIKHMVGRDATDEVNALHSPAARRRMNPYQIGRIEGHWDNFVPPIQGGVFRRVSESEDIPPRIPKSENNARTESSSSEDDSSQTPSPVFEAPEHSSSTFRRRKEGSYSRSSSISSVDLDVQNTRMSHLDAKTHEEIKLDKSKYPPLSPNVQDEIVRKYRLLDERIKAEGLYQCNYYAYLPEITRYILLFALSIYFLRREWYLTSAVFLGLFWHQLVFTAHDAGHNGITHNHHVDSVIGIIIGDFIGGLSIGWWKKNHNVHHIVTNSPEHDPDIQHMPLFAISHRLLESLRSTYYERIMTYDAVARALIRVQHYLYYIILSFGRFNLYRLSWTYLLGGQAPRKGPAWWHFYLELLGQIFFWSWFGYGILYRSVPTTGLRIGYLLVSHIVTMPVHVQITLSHFAMSTADLGVHESFPQKMLRTTMDVDCPPWLDFIHGGLQFQVVHHLYPRIPRHNLRRVQKLVMEFCQETGIPYALFGFADGNKVVIGRLGEVSRQAAILAKCQQSMVQSGDLGLH